MLKSLKDISWLVDEPTYRADKALSYSTISKFKREGFEHLDTLFDKVESPSLLLGSLVDCLTTDPPEEYERRYLVAEFPPITDKVETIVKSLFNSYSSTYDSLYKIPDNLIIDSTNINGFQLNWKPETRAKVIKERASDYYNLLYLAKDKILISTELNDIAHQMANALIESSQTALYFKKNNPFDDCENLYQLKFKAEIDGVPYRCMFDILRVDYKNKTIQPIDVKTSYKPTYNFYKSFIEWNYAYQCRLYAKILKLNIEKDEYFKDFTVLPYKDIVISKSNMIPLVWDCDFTFVEGTLYLGKNNQIKLEAPWEVGKELWYYLSTGATVPMGINIESSNNLRTWIDKME